MDEHGRFAAQHGSEVGTVPGVSRTGRIYHPGGDGRHRGALAARLIEGAARWRPWLASLPDERLDGRIDYRGTDGQARSLPFSPTLAHVFNHGTHHRGQISAALTALGHPAPELDLVWMLQAESTPA